MEIYTLTKDYTLNKTINGSLLKGDRVMIQDEVNDGCKCVRLIKFIVDQDGTTSRTHTQSCGYGNSDQVIAEYTESMLPLYKRAFPDLFLKAKKRPFGFQFNVDDVKFMLSATSKRITLTRYED